MNDRYCPDHGDRYDPIDAWGRCPIAEEGDPPAQQTCHHFVEEIDRRIRDVTENGNYSNLLPREPGQPMMVQEYRNHEPYGEPRPIGT